MLILQQQYRLSYTKGNKHKHILQAQIVIQPAYCAGFFAI